MVYSFYFLCFGSRRNECNSLWRRERGEKSEVYCLLGRYIVRSLFSLFIVYSKYIFWGEWYMLQYSGEFIVYQMWDDSHLCRWRAINQYQNKPQPSVPFPISFPKTIVFIPSGAKTQKKEILPYPRCGFGACLRCGRAF